MMGRREEADSNLRKDMFNSILATFLAKDPSLRLSSEEVIRQQILSLELLAYNFHESLDIGPLFKDVERRISLEERGTNEELRKRLESVALQVIEHQLTALSDVGMVERGDALPDKIKDFQAHILFGTRTIPDPQVKPGQGASRLCLSMEAPDPQGENRSGLSVAGAHSSTDAPGPHGVIRLVLGRALGFGWTFSAFSSACTSA